MRPFAFETLDIVRFIFGTAIGFKGKHCPPKEMKRQQQRRKSTINSNSNCSSDSRWLRCWLCLLPLLVLATLLQIRQLLRAGIQLNKRGPGNKSAEAPIISTSMYVDSRRHMK